MEWIKRSDQQPPKDKIILITDGIDIGLHESMEFSCQFERTALIFAQLDFTHWQALPDLPKD